MVTSDHVWDGFMLLALLEDCQRRLTRLLLPHTGAQKDRFKEAIHARNVRFRLYSQPTRRHHCSKCLRLFPLPNGGYRKVWVVVVDGITIGHPCCAVHNCFNPLASNRHRFCPYHTSTHGHICAVVGCNSPVTNDSLVCAEASHKEVERIRCERGQARFQLQQRLQRARVAYPNNSAADDTALADLIDDEASDETFSVAVEPTTLPAAIGVQRKSIRAQFGRKCTHNEQIIVCPCGIIIARETFFGAEGVASVAVCGISFRGMIALNYDTGDDQTTFS